MRRHEAIFLTHRAWISSRHSSSPASGELNIALINFIDKSNCSLDQILLTDAKTNKKTLSGVSHEGTSNCKQSINKPVGGNERPLERGQGGNRFLFFFFLTSPSSSSAYLGESGSMVKVSALEGHSRHFWVMPGKYLQRLQYLVSPRHALPWDRLDTLAWPDRVIIGLFFFAWLLVFWLIRPHWTFNQLKQE